MWSCLCRHGLVGRKLALPIDKIDQQVFLNQLLSECNIIEDWFHASLLESWIDRAVEMEPLAKRVQGEHWSVLRQQLDDIIYDAVKSTEQIRAQAVTHTFDVPSIPMARTRLSKYLSAVNEDVDRNLVEQNELQRWSSEFRAILISLDAPVLEELQSTLDPERSLECLTGSFRASSIRGYVRAWKCFQRWLIMCKGKHVRTSAADYIDYIFFRRDEPCGKTVPNCFLQAVRWIEAKAGLPDDQQYSKSIALKSVIERITGELQSSAPPIKRAPRMMARIIEEMEAYVLSSERPVYLRCIAWIRLIKTWATLRYDCHTHIDPAEIRFYEGRLTVTLRKSKTTGANKRVSELPIIVSEHAYIRDPGWCEKGFELLRSIAPYRRDYLLPAPSRNWSGTLKKLATYEIAAAAGHALLSDLRRSNDDSRLVPNEVVPFFTEHSERATAPSLLATLGVQKSERDLLGRWCPEGSDTYMRTYRTVVSKLQQKMAVALRSPTRYKDLEEHEIIPELVIWLRDRAHFNQVNANEVAETFASIMKTSSFAEDWIADAPTQTMLFQDPTLTTIEENRDSEEEEEPLQDPPQRPVDQYMLVHTAGKRGATLHNTGNCWMAKSRSFTSWEICTTCPDSTKYRRVCKLCWPDGVQVQEQESSSSGTDDDLDPGSIEEGEEEHQLRQLQTAHNDTDAWSRVEESEIVCVDS